MMSTFLSLFKSKTNILPLSDGLLSNSEMDYYLFGSTRMPPDEYLTERRSYTTNVIYTAINTIYNTINNLVRYYVVQQDYADNYDYMFV